jgi:hypothetical protein
VVIFETDLDRDAGDMAYMPSYRGIVFLHVIRTSAVFKGPAALFTVIGRAGALDRQKTDGFRGGI